MNLNAFIKQACSSLVMTAGWYKAEPYANKIRNLTIMSLAIATLLLIIITIFCIRKAKNKDIHKWPYVIPMTALSLLMLGTLTAIPLTYNNAKETLSTQIPHGPAYEKYESNRDNPEPGWDYNNEYDAAIDMIDTEKQESNKSLIYTCLSVAAGILVANLVKRKNQNNITIQHAIIPLFLSQYMIYNTIAAKVTNSIHLTDMDYSTYVPLIIFLIVTVPILPLFYVTIKKDYDKIMPSIMVTIGYIVLNLIVFTLIYNCFYQIIFDPYDIQQWHPYRFF